MKAAKSCKLLLSALLALASPLLPPTVRAADHGDAPTLAHDQAADLADVYFFLDPTDNNQAVLILTARGFITPGEAVNFAVFDPSLLYQFQIENSGDATPDKFINVIFNQRTADPGPTGKEILQIPKAQTATIRIPRLGTFAGGTFTAPVLNPNLGGGANTPTATTLKFANGQDSPIKFFAGEVDDPFFFDIPGFSRFVASVRNSAIDPNQLNRGRDTFAGYNVLAIALQMPVALLRGTAGDEVGLGASTQRRVIETPTARGEIASRGAFRQVDRTGVPAVNVALVPFNRKNEYNASSSRADAQLRFGGDILATLNALGTTGAGTFPPTGNALTLAQVAVLKGDLLRLNTNATARPNTGTGGGNNDGSGFPNGRRLRDDVVDTLLFFITNGVITQGDNVDASISQFPLQNAFPFLAPAQQPVASADVNNPSATDDKTQN